VTLTDKSDSSIGSTFGHGIFYDAEVSFLDQNEIHSGLMSRHLIRVRVGCQLFFKHLLLRNYNT
jgi:hypothetical protein